MGARQVEQERRKGNRRVFLISSLGFLFTILLLVVIILFPDEFRNLGGYGYIGVFIVGTLSGISVVPAPTIPMVFFLGGALNPTFVGLTAGFGAGLGGITVYLTGAGVETMWSRLRSKEQAYENEPGRRYDIVQPVESQLWSKGEILYDRLVKRMGGRGGYWILFITSAMLISPFYFAGLAAGSFRMGLLKFFLISWAGKTVRYLTISFAGYYGLNVLLRWTGG
ncbi:MAG: hypothetical protein QF713_01615 [Dehalococcoidales bacterium]|nr:hypothetical protein [Dehalococcoidales bacterium]